MIIAPLATRFWSKVDLSNPDGCWIWAGSRRHAYGEVWVDGRKEYAHRAAFFLIHGYWPEAVLHLCDTPLCVRPDHLRGGTQRDNIADAFAKHRMVPPPIHKGEAHPRAKLTVSDVREIRRTYEAGSGTQYEIADRFGVSQTVVSSIVRRKTWREVA